MEGALWGAFSAAVFFGIGQHFSAIADANAAAVQGGELEASKLVLDTGLTAGQFAAQSISHGIAGGTIAEMQGGKFGYGFLSAGLSKAATPKVMSLVRNTFAQGAMLAIVGVGISRVSGGKFANGAATAAMAFAFGQLGQRSADGSNVITGSRGRGQAVDGDVPVSSGIIGRMAADGHGPPVHSQRWMKPLKQG